MKALIIYHTLTGHTERAARDIAKGLSSQGIDADLVKAKEADPDSVKDYDILLVGTPTYGHRLYRKGAVPVTKFMKKIPQDELEDKVVGFFAVHAAAGGELIVKSLEKKMSRLRARVVSQGPVVKAGAPLSLWKGPDAGPNDVKKLEEFGRRVAKEAQGE